MQTINLVKNIEYNRKYRIIDAENKYLDGNYPICDTIDLFKNVYNANELVNISPAAQSYVDDVKNSFISTFKSRGGATDEQINFAEQTAQVIFGDLKEEVVTVIPAPCGFGKSSVSLEILKKLIELYKQGKCSDGLILVSDRLDSLRKTQEDLKELGLDGYSYMMESWNETICLNRKIKDSDAKMCTPINCPLYFYQCKIYKQQNEQKKFPILLITNARLKECSSNIKQYATWNQNDKNETGKPSGKRNILLIDERPDFLDTIKVNKKLLNEISTEISKCEYPDPEKKTVFENMFADISNNIIGKMQKLRKNYKRFILSNANNEPICLTDENFMELWERYMGKSNCRRELEHIHTVLTKGGFYVYEKHTEFISTIGSRDLKDMYSETFKTIVFDGSALYDPLYLGMYKKGSIKYLNVENTRLYNNLNIHAYILHKLTKTNFKDKGYLIKACAKFVNEKMRTGTNRMAYVISYQTITSKLNDFINRKYNIARLNDELFYFGNTKGKNDMQECNVMFQFGWDTLPDYEYVISWMSVCIDWDKLLKSNKCEEFSEKLIVKDRSQYDDGNYVFDSGHKNYEFGIESLNLFKMYITLTNFYQEVHRTKLRNYNCTTEKIDVFVFSIKNVVLDMIEQLFPKCSMNKIRDEVSCFQESKVDDRANGDKAQILKDFIDNDWKIDEQIKIKDIVKKTGLTNDNIQNLKRRNNYFTDLFLKYKTEKNGTYKKIS